jgi:pimeloyl-ACP methyl ester carboxylesterase
VSAVRYATVHANGIDIHYVEAGHGPLVVLLHGFPEFWYGWRRQIPALAEAGFRVVAPDLRGYNRSERPSGIAAYRMDALVEDVVAVIGSMGGQAVLVGHDWGGVIAWYTAMHHPASVRRLVILNAPHPAAYARELRRLSSQWWRSAYAGFFQLPRLPEKLWRARDFALLRRVLRGGPADDEEDIRRYVEAFAAPGALSAALHYYRAALRCPRPRVRPIDLPTLILWGERDRYLSSALTRGLEPWVRDLTVERLPRATHWLHHEEPDTVNTRIAAFAREEPDRSA